jgi:cysteine-rich repeat protein
MMAAMPPALRYALVLIAVGALACSWETSTSTPPACGDGVQNPPEECDKGPENSDTTPGACRTTCLRAGCGDGVIDPGEVCDDGNRFGGDGCAATCHKVEQCGDGFLDPGAEQCDLGANNSDTRANQCRTTCKLPSCGDGVGDEGEECDDGNRESGDTCDSNCTRPRCGNGVTGAGEECDDTNTFNTDACLPNCRQNRCSGGVDGNGNACFHQRTFPLPGSDLRAVEVADLDGNGSPDIAVVDFDDDLVRVFWNSGGTFTQTEIDVDRFFGLTVEDPVDLAIGDINGDGRLDMVTTNENRDVLCVLENRGNRAFNRHFIEVAGRPTDVTLANVDGAPGLELVVGLEGANEVRVLRLNGFAQYGMPQVLPASGPEELGAGDVDGDGDADLCWTSGTPYVAVNEGGQLVRQSVPKGPSSGALKLLELDGAAPAELVVGNYGLFSSEHLRVFSNPDPTNATVFEAYTDVPVTEWPMFLAPFGSGVAYADNDGAFGVLRNEGGKLLGERLFTYDGDAQGLASGDLNGDGAPDLVIISAEKEAVLLFSGSGP